MSYELSLATTWHDPAQRRREAVRAAHEGDNDALLDLLDTYLSYRGRKRSRTSKHTRYAYAVAARDWLHYCWPSEATSPEVSLLKAERDDVERYVALLLQDGGHLDDSRGEPLTPGSAATYLAGVRALYRALVWAGAVTVSPAQDVVGPSDPRPRHERRPAMPWGDYQRLLEHCEGDDPLSLRMTALLRLLGDQGLRVSEVVGLGLEHLDLRDHTLFVANGKGGRSRTLPLTRASEQALRRWLGERRHHAHPDERAVLVNVGKTVKAARRGRAMHVNTVRLHLDNLYKEVGVSGRYRGAHTLRHTAGTRLYRKTRDLHVVSQVLGHSDINTSSIYAKMDIEGVRQAMAKLDDDE
ncbi:MAG: tyrosine-type recombinase/integrase [Trueperaceae bacterium]|nr:tyrosine-type recombinase/integrase [Trueperaceae bacterium]